MGKPIVTKAMLESENKALQAEIRLLRNEVSNLNKIPKFEQSMFTPFLTALEKTTDAVAHVLYELSRVGQAKGWTR